MASNALASNGFPDVYYNNLVASAASVKYVSTSGSDTNNGNSIATAYKTIAYAVSANSATATAITIVVLPGTYVEVPIAAGSSYAAAALTDGNKPRVFVCSPGQVKIQFSDATMSYGPYPVNFQNSGSAVYGAIFERNNGGRSANYAVALFCGSATVGNLKGNFYNCGFTETNANNSWAFIYDNEGSIASQVNNCTFKFAQGPQADYNGGAGMTVTSCVFNTVAPTGNSVKVGVLASQTVSSTYVTTGVTTAGVYSGTYAWNGTITYPLSTAVVSGTTGSPSTAFANINGTNYKYYAFTSSGSITFSAGGDVDVLLVAGGGAGSGGTLGGGGGAGGLLTSTVTTTATTYTITIGAGGTGGNPVGGNGGNTTALGLTAIGGGFGGTYGSNNQIGANGGSGGGGTYYPTTTGGIGVYPGSTYLNQARQGYDGGVGRNFSVGAGTGGGGGAGAIGGAAGANDPGPSGTGGVGLQLNYNGSNVYYAGGGGGGGYNAGNDQGGGGGLGGGAGGGGVALGTSDTARGATAPTTTVGGTAGVNTGGGGGGAPGTGGSGGSGIVIIRYSAQALGVFASSANVLSGANVTFTLYSANTGNIPYTITGITTDIISNASLTGNFVVSGGSGTVTFTTKSLLTSNYSMSITAEGNTAIANINPNVTITTTVIGTGYSGNSTYISNPVTGQMNIPDTVVTVAQYDKGGSIQSSFPVAGQMNIIDNVVTLTDVTLGSIPILPGTSSIQNSASITYTTITNKIAGTLDQGIVKLFGDNPNREFWM